jgi:hypothetical protein
MLSLTAACHVARKNTFLAHEFSEVEQGARFAHRIWHRDASIDSGFLHIYLHGDGMPWLAPGKIALDPTGHHVLEASLWSSDPAEAYFVGRPCYFRVPEAVCSPKDWTSGRYSSDVVESLATLLLQIS